MLATHCADSDPAEDDKLQTTFQSHAETMHKEAVAGEASMYPHAETESTRSALRSTVVPVLLVAHEQNPEEFYWNLTTFVLRAYLHEI